MSLKVRTPGQLVLNNAMVNILHVCGRSIVTVFGKLQPLKLKMARMRDRNLFYRILSLVDLRSDKCHNLRTLSMDKTEIPPHQRIDIRPVNFFYNNRLIPRPRVLTSVSGVCRPYLARAGPSWRVL